MPMILSEAGVPDGGVWPHDDMNDHSADAHIDQD